MHPQNNLILEHFQQNPSKSCPYLAITPILCPDLSCEQPLIGSLSLWICRVAYSGRFVETQPTVCDLATGTCVVWGKNSSAASPPVCSEGRGLGSVPRSLRAPVTDTWTTGVAPGAVPVSRSLRASADAPPGRPRLPLVRRAPCVGAPGAGQQESQHGSEEEGGQAGAFEKGGKSLGRGWGRRRGGRLRMQHQRQHRGSPSIRGPHSWGDPLETGCPRGGSTGLSTRPPQALGASAWREVSRPRLSFPASGMNQKPRPHL